LGRHIYEFKDMDGSSKDSVPEIFLALISYFEANPHLMQT